MKTKSFIEKVKELGFEVTEESNLLFIRDCAFKKPVVSVNKHKCFQIDSRWDHSALDVDILKKLFNYTVEYARTPIKEREEEKKFYVKVKNSILKEIFKSSRNEGYLNNRILHGYFLSDESQDEEFITQFTQREIDNFPDEVKALLPLCEKIEVSDDATERL